MADWALLERNPAPGDVQDVLGLAGDIGGVADAARQSHQEMRGIATSRDSLNFEGKTAEAFAEQFEGVVPDVEKMAESYERLERALKTYANELGDLQRRARSALKRAEAAESRRRTAEASVNQASSRLATMKSQLRSAQAEERRLEQQSAAESAALSPTASSSHALYLQAKSTRSQAQGQVDNWTRTKDRAEEDRTEAERDLRMCRRDAEDIHHDFKALGRRIADQIDDALGEGLRNRNFFQRHVIDRAKAVWKFVADAEFLDIVYELRKILDFIDVALSVVLVVLAVVAFATGVGAPLGLLLAAAAVASLKALTTVILVEGSGGTYTAKDGTTLTRVDMGVDIVGAGLSIVGAKGAWSAARLSSRGGTTAKSLYTFPRGKSGYQVIREQGVRRYLFGAKETYRGKELTSEQLAASWRRRELWRQGVSKADVPADVKDLGRLTIVPKGQSYAEYLSRLHDATAVRGPAKAASDAWSYYQGADGLRRGGTWISSFVDRQFDQPALCSVGGINAR